MRTILILLTLLLVGTQSLTIGSCQKFSLDGQKCQVCVQHFHLYEGNCYVDILGCQSYIFGNICHQCENGYILINNLCCDHNCLAKLFKRHDSKTLSKTINDNYEIFSRIIPLINQKFMKNSLYNLVEIEQKTYKDVVRNIFLYGLTSNREYTYMRVIVDYMISNNDLIVVDFSQVNGPKDWTQFHYNQVSWDSNTQVDQMMNSAFDGKPSISLLRKFNFTEIDQFQIVLQNAEFETIIYQTFYLNNNRKVILISEEKPMP